VCRTVVAIEFYKGPSNKYVSVEARFPGIFFSGLRSAITTSRKNGKTEKPVLEFRCCTYSYRVDFIQAGPPLTNRNSMNSGAEVLCVPCVGQMDAWLKRALLIWSTSTNHDQKRFLY
jgi:hypothetical protein